MTELLHCDTIKYKHKGDEYVNILDIASSAALKITRNKGKRAARKSTAPAIPDAEPVCIKNSTSDGFRVGFAKKTVVPDSVTDRKYYMAGFKCNNVITGIHDPQTVSAMWIDCKGDEGIILVSVDAVGLTGHDVNEIRASLAGFCKKSGCRYIDISCTHTHAGIDTVGYWGPLPITGRNKAFQAQLFSSVCDVCRQAYENRREGRLYSGYIHVPEAIHAGRFPHAVNDKLSRIRFVPDDGTEETWFMNYSAHSDSLGGSCTTISSDYAYFMREAINARIKTNVLFSVGAIASVGISNLSENRWERSRLAGKILAVSAFEIDNDTELESEITFIQQKYYAPVDNRILALMPMVGVCTSDIAPYPDSETGLALVTEMTYLKLGQQKILILPGEIFTEIVYGGYASAEDSATGRGAEVNPVPFCQICDDPELMVFGVSNDMTGYIVPPNDWLLHPTQPYLTSAHDKFDRNHYNETNSLGIKTASVIEEIFRKMTAKM